MQEIINKSHQAISDTSAFLAAKNIEADISEGEQLDSVALDALESKWQVKLPESLRQYWMSFGDGFDFQYEWINPESGREELFTWGLSSIEDINDEREEQLEILEDIRQGGGLDSYGFQDDQPNAEANVTEKLQWLPVFGVGDGGTLVCVDTATLNGSVRCFETFNYTQDANQSITIAESVFDWLNSWSLYCFSDPAPNGAPIYSSTYFETRSGHFEWPSEEFLEFFNRNNA